MIALERIWLACTVICAALALHECVFKGDDVSALVYCLAALGFYFVAWRGQPDT